MPDRPEDRTAALHALAATLPRHRFPVSRLDIPANGVYLLFEAGETAPDGAGTVDRIVRAGSHTGEDRLARRLGAHVAGDRRRSAFRLHLGAALLARDDPADPRLAAWLGDERTPMPEVEAAVSAAVKERFTVACIPVPDKAERLALERGIVALLAQHPLAPPSGAWLGRHASPAEIRRSGLWATQHVNGDPLTKKQLTRIETLIAAPAAEVPAEPGAADDPDDGTAG